MSKREARFWICSTALAVALCGVASGGQGTAFAGGASAPQDSGVPSGVSDLSTEDFGGTPANINSVTSGSKGSSRKSAAQTDQTKAREAVEKGEVRPLGWLLKRLGRTVPGDVVKVRLKRQGQNQWTYDVTVLNASGRYVLVSLNAATGAIIKSRPR